MTIANITADFIIHEKVENEANIKCTVNNLTQKEIIKMRKMDLKETDFDLEHLTDQQKQSALTILMNKSAAFSKSYETLGENSMVTPKFNLLHDYPINTKPYPLPHSVRPHAQKEIEELLKAGIIEESTSHYSFPVIFVKKKNSKTNDPKLIKYRMATDFRLLNQLTPLFPFKLPHIKTLLQEIAGQELYTVLDLKAAFFQINVPQEERHKLAFSTEFGHFQFKKLPFGSKNSSTYFALLIDKCLKPLKHLKVRHFLDDIIIPAENFQEMSHKLTRVLNRLIEFNLTIDPSKTQLFKQNIDFLGYEINKNGFRPSQANIHKINKFPKPNTPKQIKSFLGLTNYFRELIDNYAEITYPLVQLTKKGVQFKWNQTHEKAFQNIQTIILNQPHLHPANFDKQFYLITDASKIAISAVITQKNENNKMIPIEFYSRKLKDSETRYQSIKRELLAIHDAILHFKEYLYGKQFIILTDAKPLTHYLNIEKQTEITARWLLDIQEYDFRLQHTPGVDNPADFLSRVVFNVRVQHKLLQEIFRNEEDLNYEHIAKEQQKDEHLKPIIDRFINNNTNAKDAKYYVDKNNYNLLMLKKLVRENEQKFNTQEYLIMVPKTMVKKIITTAHKSHFGTFKTYQLVKQYYFWFGMRADIKQYIDTCLKCNLFKTHKTIQQPLQKVNKDYGINEYIFMDIIGPLPKSINKNIYALTLIDNFSRYLEVIPLHNINALTITKALAEYFARYGMCSIVQTDNGLQFISKEFTQYLRELGIEHRRSSIYLPRSNGMIERSHSTLKNSIAAMCDNQWEWDIRLLYFKLAYNTTIHKATGFTPAFLYFNRHLRTPFNGHVIKSESKDYSEFLKSQMEHIEEVRKIALANMDKLMKQYTDENKKKPNKVEIGDTIFLKQLIAPRTFEKKFSGPYSVVKKFRNNNILIQSMEFPFANPIKIHISKIFKIPVNERQNLKSESQTNENDSNQSNDNTGEITNPEDENNHPTTSGYNLRKR
jgi:hypothetical protein